MTLAENTFMGTDSHKRASCFGLAVADQLRGKYPFHTIKLVARDLGISPKTAENILAGHLSAKSITRLTLAYGLGFLIDAGAAVTGTSLEIYIIEQAQAARDQQREWERREQEHNANLAALAARPSRAEGQSWRVGGEL